MSRQADEYRDRGKSRARGGQTPRATSKGLSSFKLTKEQIQDVRDAGFNIAGALAVLESRIGDGLVKITLGRPVDREGRYAVLRDPNASWDEGQAVSCWGRSVETALVSAAYYLSSVNPDFPDGISPTEFPELEF